MSEYETSEPDGLTVEALNEKCMQIAMNGSAAERYLQI